MAAVGGGFTQHLAQTKRVDVRINDVIKESGSSLSHAHASKCDDVTETRGCSVLRRSCVRSGDHRRSHGGVGNVSHVQEEVKAVNVKTIGDDEEEEDGDVSDHSDEEQNKKRYITVTSQRSYLPTVGLGVGCRSEQSQDGCQETLIDLQGHLLDQSHEVPEISPQIDS